MAKGFVKPKKIWTKRFSDEEIKLIFDQFILASPVSKEEWEETNLLNVIREYGNFCHPETDKFDDTEGFKPQQIKDFLSFHKIENLNHFFKLLNIYTSNNFFQNYLSDGFISWQNVFENIRNYLLEEDSFNVFCGKLIVHMFERNFFQRYTIDIDLLEIIGSDLNVIQNLKESEKAGLIVNNKITIASLSIEHFLEERRILWKEVSGLAPQSTEMLKANPHNFCKEFLTKISEIFETRQIGKLTEQNQHLVALMNNLFGVNVTVIDKEKLLTIGRLNGNNRNDLNLKDYRPVLSKIIKSNPTVSINSLFNFINIFHVNEGIYEAMLKKDEITKEDTNLYAYMHNMFDLANDNTKKKLRKLDLYFWKTFFRYGVGDPYQISELISLYEKNKDNTCSIPNIKGTAGSYDFELIKKDDPIGLILGYSTDCCQVIGNQGENCLRYGYTQENSTFFVVKKKGKVFAQSWVWSKEYAPGKKAICFDSVEVLGKDLEKSKNILDAYKEVSKILAEEHEYDMVICGADGSTMPNGLEKIGKKEGYDYIQENNLGVPWNIYSDAKEDIIIIRETNE